MKWLARWFVLGLPLVTVGAAIADSQFLFLPIIAAVLVIGFLVLERRFARRETRDERRSADVPR
jgi:hypothetical protein